MIPEVVPFCSSYLRPTFTRRRGCMVFEFNPNWDGVLRLKAGARGIDPAESHDAAANVRSRDIFEVREIVDLLLKQGRGVISTEVREFVLSGLVAGRIAHHNLAFNVRAESLRRRFSDLCP